MRTKDYGQRGVFFGNYGIRFNSEHGMTDFSRHAFLFPGQGSSFPGMMKELYEVSEIVRKRFKTADEVTAELGFSPVSEYILNPAELDPQWSWILRNIALFTLEIALAELLIAGGRRPHAVTGHSYGEYAALAVSGIADFQEMARFLILRDRCCSAPQTIGELWAVRGAPEQLLALSKNGSFHVSNQNSPSQTVIAVAPDRAKEVAQLLKQNRLPMIRLEVPQPYHSPLMRQAADAVSRELRDFSISFRSPTIPVFSSVLHRWLTRENFATDDALAILHHQMVEPVNFIEQIHRVQALGLCSLIEVGPGKTLTTFTQEILSGKDVKIRQVEEFAKISPAKRQESPQENHTWSDKLMKAFNRALSAATGYEVESVTVKDRVQEDLGIDSIRKAEIIFEVLDEMGLKSTASSQGVVLSSLSTVDDVLRYFDRLLRSEASPTQNTHDIQDKTFRLLKPVWKPMPFSPFVRTLTRKVRRLELPYRGDSDFKKELAEIDSFTAREGNEVKLIQVLLDPPFSLNAESLTEGNPEIGPWLENLMHVFRSWIIAKPRQKERLSFQWVYDSKNAILGELIRSSLASWAHEQGGIGFKSIEVPSLLTPGVLESLEQEDQDPVYPYVRYNDQGRFVVVLEEAPAAQGQPKVLEDAAFVIFGGHRGIGWEIAKSLSRFKSPRITLAGRAPENTPFIQARLQELQSFAAEAVYRQCDITDPKTVEQVLTEASARSGRVDHVVNSAGIALSRILPEMSDDDIHKEFIIRWAATLNLIQITRKIPIDCVTSFSSTAAHYGGAGQAVYALGNSAVDLPSKLFPGDRTRFLTFFWPPWKETGLTEDPTFRSFVDVTGLTYLEKADGVDLYWKAVATAGLQSTVVTDESSETFHNAADVDKKAFRQFFSSIQCPVIGGNFDVQGLTLQNLPFLREHRLEDRPVLASSNMVALFLQIGFMRWGEIPDLEDFVGHNFIFLNETESQVFLEAKRSKDEMTMRLKSALIHAEARLKKRIRRPTRKIDIPAHRHRLSKEGLRNSVVQTLGVFDQTHTVWATPETRDLMIEFKTRDLHHCTEMALFDRLFQLLEIGYQAFGFTAFWKTERYSVPRGLGRLEIETDVEWTDTLFATQKVLAVDENEVRGDAHIVNSRGEVLLSLSGVRFGFLSQKPRIRDNFKVID